VPLPFEFLSRQEFGRAVDDHVFDFSSGFVHPNADFVLAEMHIGQEVIYVRHGV
jgi:hypothetical protein